MLNNGAQRNSCHIFGDFNQNSLTRGRLSCPQFSEFQSLIKLTNAFPE